LDPVTLIGALIEIIGGVFVAYLLRKQKLEILLGISGSIILLGGVILVMVYALVSGPIVWITTALAVVVFVSSSYFALRNSQTPS
jgi:drug/metabolite transporter superfamily protein YnfA